MVTAKKCRAMCLALEDASEAAHFDRAAFRTSQRIYATLAADEKSLNVKLTPEQQELLVTRGPRRSRRSTTRGASKAGPR